MHNLLTISFLISWGCLSAPMLSVCFAKHTGTGAALKPFLPAPLTDADRTEIVRLLLTRAVIDKRIQDYTLLKDKHNIVVSRAHVHPAWLPQRSGISFISLGRKEIQQKADSAGDFLYLEFGPMRRAGAMVKAKLNTVWAVGQDSRDLYMSGGGFEITYERSKDDKKWQECITCSSAHWAS